MEFLSFVLESSVENCQTILFSYNYGWYALNLVLD